MTIDAERFARTLRRLTLIYLGGPVAVFFLGWLRLPLALVLVGFLGWACWRMGWGNARGRGANAAQGAGRRLELGLPAFLLGAALPGLAFVAMSGAGGWGSGDSDWFKHDMILRDLVERPWPVVYGTTAGPVLLVYYVAFYLPAALVGKWTGSWMLASHTLGLTMLAGLLLSLGWLSLLGAGGAEPGENGASGQPRARSGWWWRGAAVFFGFSGLDVLGKMAVNISLHLPVFFGDWSDVEWWAQAFQYPSNAAALFWAPHQAIGAWLPCALVLASARRGGLAARGLADEPGVWNLESAGGLPLALAWLWSPFAAIGLAPVLLGLLLFGNRADAARPGQRLLRAARSPVNLGAAAIFLVATLYYAARVVPFAVPAVAVVTPGRSPAPLLNEGLMPLPVLYVLFVALEFGLLAAALWWTMSARNAEEAPAAGEIARGGSGDGKLLLGIASTVLLLLPLVHYGYANDLVMRGGLPALFVLQVLVLRALGAARTSLRAPGRAALVALLLAGALNVGVEYRRHVSRMLRDASWRDAARDDLAARRDGRPLPVQSLLELQRGLYHRPGFDFARQYLGSTNSFYNLHLAPPEPEPPRPMPE